MTKFLFERIYEDDVGLLQWCIVQLWLVITG